MLNTKVNVDDNEQIHSNISPKQNIEFQPNIITQNNMNVIPTQEILQDNVKTNIPFLEFSLQYPQPFGNIKIKLTHNNQFIFSNNNNDFIGQFEMNDVFSLIKNTQNNIDAKSKQLIEMTILSSINGNFKINTTSPFMNDIDLLIELNKISQKYEETISQTDDNKIVRRFICMLIEHTLNTISIVSKKLKDTQYDKLKNKLMRYSTGLVYKLTYYIQLSLVTSEKQYLDLKNTIEQIQTIENKLEQKITSLEQDANKKI